MTKQNNGGPAFPCVEADGTGPKGMTLRDWFAGQALAAVMKYEWGDAIDMACNAYEKADAMLSARKE